MKFAARSRSPVALVRTVCTAILCFVLAPLHAASVGYSLLDVPDVSPGDDLWQVTYTLIGPLPDFHAVNLQFDAVSFRDLTLIDVADPATVSALLTAPDPGLPADGQLTLTALAPLAPAYQSTVSLSFVWIGAGVPGSQSFQILDDQFSEVGNGLSHATAVPEPASGALMLAGLAIGCAGAARARRRRWASQAEGRPPPDIGR